ncbi:fused MFS/spermidine synthase [Gallaecimonas kandeliae]|uniref:fused MFS/spermidine synthase n=1 Tax=Gallaecimonas kandeliae TaxID=3029055 RepID=UPI0026489F90|nr:fused MFS/spermidine synthase [Gallaecimonas kandeliae]WKE64064.1 fused MFS/spermidine synthase [Gallaecimonas kandeliae]
MSSFNLLVFTLAFTSGFCVMAVELLGGRILAPYFGSSIYVWGSIITVFMVALALGYLIGGRLSLAGPSLRRFALFYLASALALLPLVLLGDGLMKQVFLHITDPRYGSLVAALGLFLLPTLVLGMISPYSVRLLVRHQQHSGQVAGVLYFVSTLGSALGTLATSFYLVLWFEVDKILWTLVALLVAGGLLALAAKPLEATDA